VLDGWVLTGVLATLFARRGVEGSVALPVTAPRRLERYLEDLGLGIVRTKLDAPALTRMAVSAGVRFGTDGAGGFVFPEFHAGFDAAYALANLVSMLHTTAGGVGSIVSRMPSFAVAHETLPCEWEAKGALMRQLADRYADTSPDLSDGLKVPVGDDWVLAIPDAMEPWIHLYSEGVTEAEARAHIRELVEKLTSESSEE
jgi:mannose-1-phosphate guanylyltransferase/phosphomannomutase